MIDKGALLEAFDIYFGTPLHAACAKAHLDCALLLLNAGEALFFIGVVYIFYFALLCIILHCYFFMFSKVQR